MQIYWQNLNQREQGMVICATTITLLYLFYSLLFSPLNTAVKNKAKLLHEKQHTINWMLEVQPRIALTTAKKITSNELLTIISKKISVESFAQFPGQLQQTSAGEVLISFEKAPYIMVIQLLWNLQEEYVFNIKQIFMEKTPVAGVIKAAITLSVM